MRSAIKKLWPVDWRDWREFWLAADALIVGVVYALGPERWQTSGNFELINQLPGGMECVGWVCLLLWVGLVVGRFTPKAPNAIRVGHAIGAGVYLLLALLTLATVFTGDAQSGAGWIHLIIVTRVHYRAGIESPKLRRWGKPNASEQSD